ncbi:MAG: serine hydrolase domain-containing protein [Longimicrobiales bacterium]|nr:serine hydrolase domain-containing protein [Longimicrobiales bacterium]
MAAPVNFGSPSPESPAMVTLLFVLLALVPSLAAGQESTPQHRVDSIFADVAGPTSPGCALSVMRDGAPIYERGYGMANLSYGIPITPSSVFHVASVSKHFTAMAVELLVDEGKVSWDDDIREYVPEVPDFGQTITLRHLVHHTSGIRDQWSLLSMAGWRWEADVVTQKDVLEVTALQTALNFAPGEQYLYSNTGFTLLAVVAERVTGKTLREFTTERLFEPLGMDQTHFHDDHQMLVRNRAWAYEPDEDGLWGWRNSIPDFDVVGATSLFTTAHDMAAWDRNFYTGQVGGASALERLRDRFVLNSGDTIDYAHGLSLGRYRGLRTEGHGGADAGYRSNFLRFPDQALSIAVLCNFPSADPGGRARRVAEVYLGDAMEAEAEDDSPRSDVSSEPSVQLSESELQALAGYYRDGNGRLLARLIVRGDTLAFDGGPSLRPLGNGRFEVLGFGEVVTFQEEGEGVHLLEGVDGLEARQTPEWQPEAGELGRHAGVYTSEELGTEYRFAVEEGRLWFHHRKLASRALEPVWEGAFRMGGNVLEFEYDPAGRPTGFTISSGRVWSVRFAAVER